MKQSTIGRRRFLQLSAGALAGPAIVNAASLCSANAQAYPSRPIRMLVGFPAGNAPDIMARLLGDYLSPRLGQQIVIDNRPGAASSIAVEAAVNAAPDGYTVIMVVLSNILNMTLYPNLRFAFLRDIAPVAGIADAPYFLMVNPKVPAKTVAEFIAYAKANPGKINFATGGKGSANHVFAEYFRRLAGIEVVHIPYRGPYIPDVLSGQVQAVIAPLPQSIAFHRSGELRTLGISTAKRHPMLPDVPTIAETLPGYEATGWYGLGAPKGMPPEVTAKLNDAMADALKDPKLIERFNTLGIVPLSMKPEGFGAFMNGEHQKWSKVIEASGIKPD
jgi:tripartite-type tricarboxylate transporter receptor subunit TctC